MGLMRMVTGYSGVDGAVDRLLEEIHAHVSAGEREFWVSYTQDDIGWRKSAAVMAPLVRRRIAQAGYEVVEGRGGGYGDDMRLKVRCPPR